MWPISICTWTHISLNFEKSPSISKNSCQCISEALRMLKKFWRNSISKFLIQFRISWEILVMVGVFSELSVHRWSNIWEDLDSGINTSLSMVIFSFPLFCSSHGSATSILRAQNHFINDFFLIRRSQNFSSDNLSVIALSMNISRLCSTCNHARIIDLYLLTGIWMKQQSRLKKRRGKQE